MPVDHPEENPAGNTHDPLAAGGTMAKEVGGRPGRGATRQHGAAGATRRLIARGCRLPALDPARPLWRHSHGGNEIQVRMDRAGRRPRLPSRTEVAAYGRYADRASLAEVKKQPPR